MSAVAFLCRTWVFAICTYANGGGFVFPSMKAHGRVPLSASVFVANHLRPAAKKAGVHIDDGQRFGLRIRFSSCSCVTQ